MQVLCILICESQRHVVLLMEEDKQEPSKGGQAARLLTEPEWPLGTAQPVRPLQAESW